MRVDTEGYYRILGRASVDILKVCSVVSLYDVPLINGA